MKILHLNSNYTYTNLHSELVEELNNLGIENFIFSPVSGSLTQVVDTTKDTHVLVEKTFSDFDRYKYYIKQRKILKKILGNYDVSNYSLIHAHTLFTDGYSALKLKRRFNIPYVVTVRNTDLNSFFKKRIFLRRVGVQILRNASQIIFLSHAYKKNTINKYVPKKIQEEINNKSSIIPSGINDFWHTNKIGKKMWKKIKFE